jgi:hypothetical protein
LRLWYDFSALLEISKLQSNEKEEFLVSFLQMNKNKNKNEIKVKNTG